ncbi:hypothetical protein L4C33_11475 [Vibrio makurazakiensis]|uniref:hypothetical protein n=1 Tax=Vibrio makurazakiensis TaxID=2910250 RepID=UPI003D0A83C2
MFKLSKAPSFILSTSILSALLGCSTSDDADNAYLNEYFPLSESVYSQDALKVGATNNIIKSAINQSQLLSIVERADVDRHMSVLFPEISAQSHASISLLSTPVFHDSLEQIISEFTCHLYSSAQPDNTVQFCPNSISVQRNNLDYLPFNKGELYQQRLIVNNKNLTDGVQVELFMKSGKELSSEQLFAPIHTLGVFPRSSIADNSLVLTINMKASTINSERVWQPIYNKPLIFFVVMPDIESITELPNELNAIEYAKNNSSILLVKQSNK